MDQPFITQSDEIIIRRTTESDLEFVLSTEHADENKCFIIPWARTRHEKALQDADILHFIVERVGDGERLGYGIIAGLLNPHSSIEFQRIVITQKNKGYGRKVLRLIKKWAFESLDVHRMWLDVKDFNHRARTLYASEGFVVEGTLRECLKADDGSFESLVVMSLLKREYQAGAY
jgi:RimJ/RimL family protein N-acetyltransferase